jgi:hypothetical protein
MPAKTSRKRRGGGGSAATTRPGRAPEPQVVDAPPVRETQQPRIQPRRQPRRPSPIQPPFGAGALAQWRRVSSSAPWMPRTFAAESPLWVVLLLTVPIVAVFLDLTVGPRLDRAPAVDVDYWWHLATGNWVLDHHRPPTTDPYSWTYGGKTWIAHEWLAETVLALLSRIGGYAANIVFTAVVAVIGFWRLMAGARSYGISRRAAAVAMLLFGGVFLRSGALVVRPQVWSWTLLAILLAELAAYDTGRRKSLWAIPILFTVWINVNLTALIGIGCLGAFVLDRLIRRPIDRHVVQVGVASGLALLVNPHHIEILLLIFKYLDPNSVRRQYIFEWMPPRTTDHSHIPYWIALVLVVPAAYALVRRRPHFWPAAPLLVLAYQSHQSIRYIPIFIMLVFIFVGWLKWQWLTPRDVEPALARSPLLPHRPWVLVPPVLASALAVWLALTTTPTQFRKDPYTWNHPAGAATFYLENYPGTRIFNTYDFGGYLIYRFYGTANKVYIDGREEMYGEERVRRYFYYIYGNKGWQDYFDQQGIQVVIIRRIDGLFTQISKDPGWKLVYPINVRGDAYIFVRKDLKPTGGGS